MVSTGWTIFTIAAWSLVAVVWVWNALWIRHDKASIRRAAGQLPMK